MHYVRLPAGVEPAPIDGPQSGQQGARAVEHPGRRVPGLSSVCLQVDPLAVLALRSYGYG